MDMSHSGYKIRTFSVHSISLLERKIRHSAFRIGRDAEASSYTNILDCTKVSGSCHEESSVNDTLEYVPTLVVRNLTLNVSESVSSSDSRIAEEVRDLYRIVVPVMLTACLLSMIFNLLILCSVKWVRRTISPTLCFSLSLTIADAYASLVVGVGLLVNSLLPIVHGVDLGPLYSCYILILESFRLGGLIVSVLHLLALAVNHYVGILRPLHYAATVTRRSATIGICAMWLFPVAFFFIYFSVVPGEGFQSPECKEYSFLLYSPFRVTVSLLFFIPLLMMTVMYVHIFFVVRQHQKGLLNYTSARQLHKNVKAVITTLLILGTYLLGWMPAVLFYVITCLDCMVPFVTIQARVRVPIAILINSLIVGKSFADPIIYVVRMPEIKNALKSLWNSRCGCVPEDETRELQSRTDTKRFVLSTNKKPKKEDERNHVQE